MDRKILAFILIIVGFLAIIAGVVLLFAGGKSENQEQINEPTKAEDETIVDKNAKTIVVYFSAQNHTRNVATKIAADMNADIFEIEPVEAYTEDDLSWTDPESRVSRERDDVSLQNVALKSVSVPNWDEYETVFLGYPIWWGGSAWPVDSFVRKVDFGNKTVIPFCTSHSSGLGTSDTDLKAKANGGDWQPGHRFSQDATDAEIKDWVESFTKKEHDETRGEENKMDQIYISINNEKLTVNLENNSTVTALKKLLPLNVTMDDLNGNEKYAYLDESLPTNAYNPKRVEAGDVMLFGDNCLVIFYKSFDTNYSYSKIGHIDNLPELGSERILMVFD